MKNNMPMKKQRVASKSQKGKAPAPAQKGKKAAKKGKR